MRNTHFIINFVSVLVSTWKMIFAKVFFLSKSQSIQELLYLLNISKMIVD